MPYSTTSEVPLTAIVGFINDSEAIIALSVKHYCVSNCISVLISESCLGLPLLNPLSFKLIFAFSFDFNVLCEGSACWLARWFRLHPFWFWFPWFLILLDCISHVSETSMAFILYTSTSTWLIQLSLTSWHTIFSTLHNNYLHNLRCYYHSTTYLLKLAWCIIGYLTIYLLLMPSLYQLIFLYCLPKLAFSPKMAQLLTISTKFQHCFEFQSQLNHIIIREHNRDHLW